VRGRFVYECLITEDIRELVSYAETECVADFWQIAEVSFVAEHTPALDAWKVSEAEHVVFARMEE